MSRMIRRRRNVVLVVLVLGLAWFVLMPFIFKDYTTGELKQDVEHHHHSIGPPDGLDPLRALKKIFNSNQVHSNDAIDAGIDDLSEIDYPRDEVPINTFHEVNSGVRLRKVDPRFLMTARLRLGHFTPVTLVENSQIIHSFKRINSPGYKGRMVQIDPMSLSSADRKIYDSGWEKYYHNEYVNNMISPQRILPDVRDPGCRSLQYSTEGFEASVVIVIHNEAWMTLLRTIHSVIDRSPANLLKEIILVDDASTFNHLSSQLSKYVTHISKIRVVRLRSHRGASYARHLGASFAKGNAIVFLDAHIECTNGWLEPLLSHVAKNATNVAVPVVDLIDDDTFAYRAYDASHIRIGGFDWTLAYQWVEIPVDEKRRRKEDTDPIRNPVMWGGIFAISRDFFNHLNGYDQSLHMLGAGQNMEMSFKIWMCGGTIETIPCSHIGHLFHDRKASGRPLYSNEALMNHAAVAHMWLDEYKGIHFQRMGFQSPPQVNNTISHLDFRNRLKCRSFDWFLRNVYHDLFAPSLALASGKIRSKMRMSSASLCLAMVDLGSERKLNISKCRSLDDNKKLWYLSQKGEIRQGDNCLDFPGSSVIIYSCHGGRGNQDWIYREDKTIQQVGTQRCLTLSSSGNSVTMAVCVASDQQIWYWKRNTGAEAAETGKHTTVVKQELAKADY